MNKVRYSAIGFALPILIYGIVVMFDDLQNPLFAKGQIQQGHAEIGCGTCHTKSPGTYRQQIQATVFYHLGMRQTSADFGYAEVSSQQCLACHERPNDRHPIYRFQEPRFADSLKQVEATSCLGCHTEHVDRRAHNDTVFCASCHEGLELKLDPIDVSHSELVKEEKWSTCLGCHDFHGNHRHETPQKLAERYDIEAVEAYLANGASPYGNQLYFEAKKE